MRSLGYPRHERRRTSGLQAGERSLAAVLLPVEVLLASADDRNFNGELSATARTAHPEPFASQVLIWLDRQRLRDLVILNDCWSLRNGGTAAMERLYLSVFGVW